MPTEANLLAQVIRKPRRLLQRFLEGIYQQRYAHSNLLTASLAARFRGTFYRSLGWSSYNDW